MVEYKTKNLFICRDYMILSQKIDISDLFISKEYDRSIVGSTDVRLKMLE